MFSVKVNNQVLEFEDKVTLKDLAKSLDVKCYVATVNNRLRELDYYLNYNCEVEFLDLTSYDATKVYETSMRYLVIMALERINPKYKVKFTQSVSRSTAIEVNGEDDVSIDEAFIKRLK